MQPTSGGKLRVARCATCTRWFCALSSSSSCSTAERSEESRSEATASTALDYFMFVLFSCLAWRRKKLFGFSDDAINNSSYCYNYTCKLHLLREKSFGGYYMKVHNVYFDRFLLLLQLKWVEKVDKNNKQKAFQFEFCLEQSMVRQVPMRKSQQQSISYSTIPGEGSVASFYDEMYTT